MSTDSIVGVAQGLDVYSGVYMYNLFQDVVVLICAIHYTSFDECAVK